MNYTCKNNATDNSNEIKYNLQINNQDLDD